MNSFEFKNIFKKLKEEKKTNQEKAGDKKYIKYSDIIEEKLISNKRPEPILRDFKQIEEERKDWFKSRNENLNTQTEQKISSQLNENKTDESNEKNISNKETKEEQQNILSSETKEQEIIEGDIPLDNVPGKFNVDINNKEWTITIDPKE
jgi:hypothetical protein